MAKLTLEELRNLRKKVQSELNNRDIEGKKIQVIIGMGTCGISAGAKNVLDRFLSVLKEKGLDDKVILRQVGCMGICAKEPTVEVIYPGMDSTVYGKVDEKAVDLIVEEHLINKRKVESLIVQLPSKN